MARLVQTDITEADVDDKVQAANSFPWVWKEWTELFIKEEAREYLRSENKSGPRNGRTVSQQEKL